MLHGIHRLYYIFYTIITQQAITRSKSTVGTLEEDEICSELTIKTPARCKGLPSGVFIVKFERNSHLFLVFLLLNLNQVNVCWVHLI